MALIKVKSASDRAQVKFMESEGVISIYSTGNESKIEYESGNIYTTKSTPSEIYEAIQESNKEFQELQKLREENSLLSKRAQELEEELSSGNKVFYNPDKEEFNALRKHLEDKVLENEMLKTQIQSLERNLNDCREVFNQHDNAFKHLRQENDKLIDKIQEFKEENKRLQDIIKNDPFKK